jgi:plasmid stabilization system protein ParE
MVAGEKTANKIRKSIFLATKQTVKQPLIGTLEENLSELNQGHRYLVTGNYKIIYLVIEDDIYIIDVFDCRQNPTKMNLSSLAR